MADCEHCDGTGSACNACNAGIMDCDCGPDQEPSMGERKLSWDAAEQQTKDDHAHVRYLAGECSHCGRERIEQLANGKVICEKCCWEPASNDYCYQALSDR